MPRAINTHPQRYQLRLLDSKLLDLSRGLSALALEFQLRVNQIQPERFMLKIATSKDIDFESVQVAFIHYSQFERLSYVVKKSLECVHLYLTSAGGVKDSEFPRHVNKKGYIRMGISRGLSNSTDYVAMNWHDAFQDWDGALTEWEARGGKGACPEFPIETLTKRKDVHLLTAVAVLCQGYLSVEAAKHKSIGDWEGRVEGNPIHEALKVMGWKDEMAALFVDTLNECSDQVHSSSWWLAPFEAEKMEDQSQKQKTFGWLKEMVLSGLKEKSNAKSSTNVGRFLNSVCECAEVTNTAVIASAYLEIVDMLGG